MFEELQKRVDVLHSTLINAVIRKSGVEKHNSGNRHASSAHNSPGVEQKPHGDRGGVGGGSKHTLISLLRAAATKGRKKNIPEFDELKEMSDKEVWAVAESKLGSKEAVQRMLDELPERKAGENLNAEDVPPMFVRRHFGIGEKGDFMALSPDDPKKEAQKAALEAKLKEISDSSDGFYTLQAVGDEGDVVVTANSPFEIRRYGRNAFRGKWHEAEAWVKAGGNSNLLAAHRAVQAAKDKPVPELDVKPEKPKRNIPFRLPATQSDKKPEKPRSKDRGDEKPKADDRAVGRRPYNFTANQAKDLLAELKEGSDDMKKDAVMRALATKLRAATLNGNKSGELGLTEEQANVLAEASGDEKFEAEMRNLFSQGGNAPATESNKKPGKMDEADRAELKFRVTKQLAEDLIGKLEVGFDDPEDDKKAQALADKIKKATNAGKKGSDLMLSRDEAEFLLGELSDLADTVEENAEFEIDPNITDEAEAGAAMRALVRPFRAAEKRLQDLLR